MSPVRGMPGHAGGRAPADYSLVKTVPVVEALRAKNSTIPISIDTCSAEVAHTAIEAGANMVNDTSALRDDEAMVRVVAKSGASIILMHRKGTPCDMQQEGGPVYHDVIAEIADFLSQRVDFAIREGIGRARIAVDPGIGFGKRSANNLTILNQVRRFAELGCPVVIGASRKRFIGELLDVADPRDRTIGSVVCATIAVINGASIVRAHDVLETVQALRMAHAILKMVRTTGSQYK